MSDEEKPRMDEEKIVAHGQASDPSEEAAASKLWAVYVSEAEKYDRALVESWKNDMEGMLIFTGLFSASLTSFIVESYKTLVPDSGDSTVQLLSQISQQLAAAANGTAFQAPAPTHFTPSATSLVCNALWFISLGLSLTCALVATLLEQWARDFLHRADMRSAPVLRARIFSYLYYGLKRFSMHTVVDIVPLLLHASLLFFFGGLIAFLIPVNAAMSIIAATLLAAVVGIYAVLTLLPLWHTDCPYHTPLSSAFWRLSRAFVIWRRRPYATPLSQNPPSPLPREPREPRETIIEAISRQATEASPPRTARDYKALAWTVKSLADDSELEPFVESLPDVLWGPSQRRFAYENHIQQLMRAADLHLQSRIIDLLRSSHSGLLLPEASQRRQIGCYKALWSIASLSQSAASSEHFEGLDFSEFIRSEFDLVPETEAVLHHSVSAIALLQLSTFLSVKNRLTTFARQLEIDAHAGRTSNIQPITAYLNSMTSKWIRYLPQPDWRVTPWPHLQNYVQNFGPWPQRKFRGLWSLPADAAGLIDAVAHFSTETPYVIFFHYLMRVSMLDLLPYRWNETRQIFGLDDSLSAPFALYRPYLESALEDVVARDVNSAGTAEQSDTVVGMLCHFWRPAHPSNIPDGVVRYLNDRHSEVALLNFASSTVFQHMWPSTLETVGHPVATWTVTWDDVETAIWRLLSLQGGQAKPLSCSRLAWAEFAGLASPSPIMFSIICMMKSLILDSLQYPDESADTPIPPFRHPLLPKQSTLYLERELLDAHGQLDYDGSFRSSLEHRLVEAKIVLISEFLCGFRSDFLPHEPTKTLDCILSTLKPPTYDIHDTHQIDFAAGMRKVLECNNAHGTNALDAINNSTLFEVYSTRVSARLAQQEKSWYGTPRPWLQNPAARTEIQEILTTHKQRISSCSSVDPMCPPANVLRVQGILDGIELTHTDS
ncbi:hypothetical protein DFH06DRAFT_1065746 [Mycena polygramma]|nr:hypothetical protein DFH06DRAFT_1065746 [Mycena polygramma]